MMKTLKTHAPWWVKIMAKIVLSRILNNYWVRRRLNIFVHGEMTSPAYAFGVLRSHLDRVGYEDLQDKVVLEVGPGDSLFSATIAKRSLIEMSSQR